MNALGASRFYTYDAVDNRISATDRNGRVRQFTYDALDRQTQESWLDTSSLPIRIFTRTFDAADQLLSETDSNSSYTYSYDLDGRVTSISNAGTVGSPTVVLTNIYTDANERSSQSATINGSPDFTNTYTHDLDGRLAQITQSGGTKVSEKRVDFAYNNIDQFTGVTRYSDLAGTKIVATTAYQYDGADRLIDLKHSRKNNSTIADYTFAWDAADRLTQFSGPDGTGNYTFDNTNQLTAANYSYQTNEGYSYSGNGNRTNPGYVTGSDNRLLADGTYNYAYDGEGNLVQKTTIATGAVVQYEYDYRNRLTHVVYKDASNVVTREAIYSYDVNDHRIGKVVDIDGVGAGAATSERLVYDGDQIVLAFNGTGGLTNRYVYGPAPDQILVDEQLNPAHPKKAGNNLWALADHIGTVRDLVSDNGQVQNHIKYDAFGRVTAESNPSVSFRFGYTGQDRDKETGLSYYLGRFYDPATGRFLNQDPLGLTPDTNPYRYVSNNPTNATDPTGLDEQPKKIIPGVNTPRTIQCHQPRQTPTFSPGLAERIRRIPDRSLIERCDTERSQETTEDRVEYLMKLIEKKSTDALKPRSPWESLLFGIGMIRGFGKGFLGTVESAWFLLKLAARYSPPGILWTSTVGDRFAPEWEAAEKAGQVAVFLARTHMQLRHRETEVITALITDDWSSLEGTISPDIMQALRMSRELVVELMIATLEMGPEAQGEIVGQVIYAVVEALATAGLAEAAQAGKLAGSVGKLKNLPVLGELLTKPKVAKAMARLTDRILLFAKDEAGTAYLSSEARALVRRIRQLRLADSEFFEAAGKGEEALRLYLKTKGLKPKEIEEILAHTYEVTGLCVPSLLTRKEAAFRQTLKDTGVDVDAAMAAAEKGNSSEFKAILERGRKFLTDKEKNELYLKAKGLADARRGVQLHHAWAKYLGGPEEQDLIPLSKQLHDAYHSGLDKILPRQKGAKYYENLTGPAREQIYRDLADYTKAFDAKHGTKIYEAMLKEGFPGS